MSRDKRTWTPEQKLQAAMPILRAEAGEGRAGLHIGSGIAESACKCLVQARLKQSGMHRTLQGAEYTLQLRRLWLDKPDTDFAAYSRMPA